MMDTPKNKIHIADYSVFGVSILISIAIGIYYALTGDKQRTTSEYLVGSRKMLVLPVAISLMVSLESSIMMLGLPAETYFYGMQWMIGIFAGVIANIAAIYIAVPLIHPLKLTSVYEYLEMRFKSRAVRLLGTLFGMLGTTLYMGIVLFGPSIALEAVTGFPEWASITAIAGAAIIYTSIGGFKAVVWTDVFQCFIMFAGFFAVLIMGTIRTGGIGKTWDIAAKNGRLNFFNFDLDPTVRHTFWNLNISGIIHAFGLIFNQSSIQRICSTPTVETAKNFIMLDYFQHVILIDINDKRVLVITTPAYAMSLILVAIEGIVVFGYFYTIGCDPKASKQISNPNQLIPFMVMDIFEDVPGMLGLFMASLFSASLSTLSTSLSSLSALFWADIVKPHVKPMSEFRATLIAKCSVVVFGVLAVGLAFGISRIGGTLIQIAGSTLSAVGGPLLGLFMLGAFIPFATAKGAFSATIISGAFTFLLAIGQMTTPGSVKNTRLPLGPVDRCPAVNATMATMKYIDTTMPPPDVTGTSMSVSDMTMNATFATSGILASTQATPASDDKPEPTGFRRLFMLSYKWFGTIGILTTMILGTIISLITGRAVPGEVDTRYCIPFFDRFCWYMPERFLKPLRCGFDFSEKEPIAIKATDQQAMYSNENDIKVTDEANDEIKTTGEPMEMTALTHDAASKQC